MAYGVRIVSKESLQTKGERPTDIPREGGGSITKLRGDQERGDRDDIAKEGWGRPTTLGPKMLRKATRGRMISHSSLTLGEEGTWRTQEKSDQEKKRRKGGEGGQFLQKGTREDFACRHPEKAPLCLKIKRRRTGGGKVRQALRSSCKGETRGTQKGEGKHLPHGVASRIKRDERNRLQVLRPTSLIGAKTLEIAQEHIREKEARRKIPSKGCVEDFPAHVTTRKPLTGIAKAFLQMSNGALKSTESRVSEEI